jgi:chromosome segregation protein
MGGKLLYFSHNKSGMRLKTLEIHGFKSFADKTQFDFHPGVTGIVGPNGCGKSNVVDAIRWVLGETSAKALRGGEMSDVIFNGTDRRKAVGMAEVKLTFADCEEALGVDYNEVSIGRRVFRDGKSEYRLNGSQCRLKDIHELFMDTGIGRSAYSIMEQGKIDQLLSSKPEDRRAVFEEAAGITKFKTQKKEALRKLEYTEANLLRITDIIEEVKRQMNSLSRQAAKARRYQALLGDVRVLDTHFSHRRFVEYSAEQGELTNSVNALTKDADRLTGEIHKREQDIVNARDSLQSLESEMAERRAEVMTLQNEADSAENRIKFNQERNIELAALTEQHTADIDTTGENLLLQEDNLKTTSEALISMEANIAKQREQLKEHQEKNAHLKQEKIRIDTELRQLHQQSNQSESTLLNVQSQLRSNLNQIETDRERNAQLVREIDTLEQDRNAKAEEKTQLEQQIIAKTEGLEKAQQDLISIEKQHQEARADHEALQKQLRELHRELSQKQSRLQVLEQLVAKGEGLLKGTQSVLKGLNQPDFFKNGVRGILSSYIETESKFIPAVEAALGNHLQAIIVSDPAMAESMVHTLTKDKMGVASIVPEQFIANRAGSQMMTVPEGAIGWALDKVKSHERARPLIESLLANVLIVETLPDALRMRAEMGGTAFATTDGAFVSVEGIIHGGSAGDGSASILQRQNEIKELQLETTEMAAHLASREQESERLTVAIKDLNIAREEKRELVQQGRISKSTLEGQLKLVERELVQMKTKLDSVGWEQGELFKRQETIESLVAELEVKRAATEIELNDRKARRADLENGQIESTKREAESSEVYNELRTNLAVEERTFQNLQQQKEPIAARMRELQELIERRGNEIASYKQRIAKAEAESSLLGDDITTKRQRAAEIANGIAVLSEQRGERAEAVYDCEEALKAARESLAKATEQKGREEVQITKIDLRIENVEETILQRYQINLETFEPDVHALLAAIEMQKKAHNRRGKRGASDESTEEENNNSEDIVVAVVSDDEIDLDTNISLEDGPDWDFVEKVVGELKQRLDSMGPVNLDAIQEFEELEERHNFLQTQHDDLVNSKAELLKIITEINAKTSEMFAETFEQVRKNFKTMFVELFGEKAQANLIMLDDEDPLESGIEVIAKPPGKKLQSITLLSGGERSMTAVALLFAIFMVKPSPFCVLDELDAPLDESNIGRFVGMLDRFIDKSQFVIVTHNKRTMNRCDVMYGVTMEEFGVSKPVGMRLSSETTTEV